MLVGGGAFIAGKVVGPFILRSLEKGSLTKTEPDKFKVIKDKKQFSVYDEAGEEIFQIDNGA